MHVNALWNTFYSVKNQTKLILVWHLLPLTSISRHISSMLEHYILTRPCVSLGQDYLQPQPPCTRLLHILGCVKLCHTPMGLATVSPAVLPPIHQPHPPYLSTLSPLRQPVSPWPCVIKLHLSIILARDAIAYHIKEVREVWFQQPPAYADLFPPNGIHTPSSTCHNRPQRWGPYPSKLHHKSPLPKSGKNPLSLESPSESPSGE